jgi:hypothetical protein
LDRIDRALGVHSVEQDGAQAQRLRVERARLEQRALLATQSDTFVIHAYDEIGLSVAVSVRDLERVRAALSGIACQEQRASPQDFGRTTRTAHHDRSGFTAAIAGIHHGHRMPTGERHRLRAQAPRVAHG